MKAVVHSAGFHDRVGAPLVLSEELAEKYPRMEKVWVDHAYQGPLGEEIADSLGWSLEVVTHRHQVWTAEGEEPPPQPRGFKVLQWRWVVERTIGWLSRCRRLARDFEASIESSTAWLYIGMIRLMLRRLAR